MHLLLLLLSLSALSQDVGFDAHGFHPAAWDGDPRDPIIALRPGAFTGGDVYLGALAEYARAPLVEMVVPEFGSDISSAVALDHLGVLNIGAGVALHRYAKLEVAWPMFFSSFDRDGAWQGMVPGDVRVMATAVFVRPPHVQGAGGPGLALVGFGDIPTGNPGAFLGQAGVTGGGLVISTYEWRKITLTANLGAQFNPSLDLANVSGSDNLLASAAFTWTPNPDLGIHLEVASAPSLTPADPFGTGSPAEALLSLRTRTPSGSFFTFGGSAGITNGVGAAMYRGFIGFGAGKVTPARPPDVDALGMFAVSDSCPGEPETLNDWKDDDGCPDELGRLSVHAHWGGSVPSGATIHLTYPDGETRDHPLEPEPLRFEVVPGTQWKATVSTEECLEGAAEVTATGGSTALEVPLERVLTSRVIVTAVDPAGLPVKDVTVTWSSDWPSCMPERQLALNRAGQGTEFIGHGTHSVTLEAPGFEFAQAEVTLEPEETRELVVEMFPIKKIQVEVKPSKVVVEKKRIVILEKVMFETAKATIRPESFDLLNQVADTIMDNPQVGRVEVAGHTDSVGSDAYNQNLSQRRADSVRVYLTGRGVADERLVSAGYGESTPIADNETDEGREENRRVEFNLIDVPDEGGQDEETPPEQETTP